MTSDGTGHTATHQAGGNAPTLIVLTPELALALDNLIMVCRLVARGTGDRTDIERELERVRALHDFERFRLGGERR